MDVAAYLSAKGLHLKRADARNVHTACVFCDEDIAKRGRLYVNIDPDAEIPGLYMCFRCGARGSLTTLKRHFGDNLNEADVDNAVRSDILAEAADFYTGCLIDHPSVYGYLRGPRRGLKKETIRDRQLGYAPMEWVQDVSIGDIRTRRSRSLYSHLRDAGYTTKDILATGLCQDIDGTILDALTGAITIPYHVAGNVVTIRGRTWPYTDDDFAEWDEPRYDPPKAKYKTCGGTSARLYGVDMLWGQPEVYITEGEFDALVLIQEGFCAVGVPGANTWQDNWDDYFTDTRRVWVVFDRDAAGERASTKLIERLGVKARRIELSEPGQKIDPTDWFANHTVDEFTRIVAGARKGNLLLTVADARAEFNSVQNTPGLKFDWELLDVLLAPGIQPGQIMVILAKTGAGKTIILLNLMHRMRVVKPDIKILFISLEQTRGEWWDRARRIHTFFDLDADQDTAERFWVNNITLIDRNRLSEAEVLVAIDDFEHHMGARPDVICLDYLGYWSRSFRGEAYERTSAAIMALKAIGKDQRIPLIVPHQVNRTGRDGEEFGSDAARESGVIEETADFLLGMWRPDDILHRDEAEKTGLVKIRILKSRHGGRGSLLEMQWAPVSLVLVPEGDTFAARARREFEWRQRYHDSWEQMVHRHRTGFEGTFFGHVPDNRLDTP